MSVRRSPVFPDSPLAWSANDPRIEQVAETGCWIWMCTIAGNGYGQVSIHGKKVGAHRAFYQRANGPVPAGLVLDHLCRTRLCVNPDHLRVCTQRENLTAKGATGWAARHAAKDKCPRCGNEYARRVSAHHAYRRCLCCQAANTRVRLGSRK